MWSLDLSFIQGLMFGIEYYEDMEEDLFYVVMDVGFLRFLYIRYTGEVQEVE